MLFLPRDNRKDTLLTPTPFHLFFLSYHAAACSASFGAITACALVPLAFSHLSSFALILYFILFLS